MKKKKPIIFAALVVAAIVVIAVILQSSNWSNLSYEAVVQETVTMSNGEIRLIVERTTEIYGYKVKVTLTLYPGFKLSAYQ